MLHLKPKAFRERDTAFFQKLHGYLDPKEPHWLSSAFHDPEFRSKLLAFRRIVFDRFILFVERQAAHWGNAYQVQKLREFFERTGTEIAIVNKQECITRLRSLGGRKARLKLQAAQIKKKHHAAVGFSLYQIGFELWKIENEMHDWKSGMRRYDYNPLLDVEQNYWHYLIILAYTSLPAKGTTSTRRSYVKNLCTWLSIPEIGLRCTQDIIQSR